MSLDGLIVIDTGGIPIFSKMIGIDTKAQMTLISGFLSAIQTFAKSINDNGEYSIKQMDLQNFKVMYRNIEGKTFVGIVNQSKNIKEADIIFEYMIWGFLSKYRELLKPDAVYKPSVFNEFESLFEKFRASSEKKLKKWIQKNSEGKHVLQGILNKLINFFPINELIKYNPKKLTVIGNRLIWVSLQTEPEEVQRILDNLKEKTSQVYGSEMFDLIKNEVTQRINKLMTK
ncbi:MAG: hypothetical protein ACXABO_11815 [Promethearchaeota archaeon]|jgi:hypothetical protein